MTKPHSHGWLEGLAAENEKIKLKKERAGEIKGKIAMWSPNC